MSKSFTALGILMAVQYPVGYRYSYSNMGIDLAVLGFIQAPC